MTDGPTIKLERWSGTWPNDDPDASFKADIAAFSLLELGPSMVERLWAVTEEAEQAPTDEERLEGYRRLRGMVSWLRVPLTDPEGGAY